MAEWRIQPGPEENLTAIRSTFFEAGQDDYTEPPAQSPDSFQILENVMPPLNGTIDRRWGTEEFSNPNIVARRMFSAYFPVSYNPDGSASTGDGRLRVILTASDKSGGSGTNNRIAVINHVGGLLVANLFTPAAGADHPHCTVANTYAYFADGVSGDLKKWTGSEAAAATQWGASPSDWTPGVPVAASGGGGNVTLNEGRRYAMAVRNPKTGHAVLFTDLTTSQPIFSDSSGPVTDGAINLTLPGLGEALTLNAAGYTELLILATADGGDTSVLYEAIKTSTLVVWALYFSGGIPINDNKSEEDLLNSNIWAEIDENGRGKGLFGSFAPSIVCPTGKYPTYHRGRIYLLQNNRLYYSRSLEEVTTSTGLVAAHPEECFSPFNVIELSTQDNENGVGLLSDGVNLYIGTVQSIRVMGGDPPNHDGPRTLYVNAGLLNPQTWKRVWHAGKAAGMIWMTPDKMVVAADGNSYRNIGQPIQTLLNSTHVASGIDYTPDKAHAMFVTDGNQELYVLALPTLGATECNRLAVYSISSDKWVVWTLTGYADTGGISATNTNVTAMNGEMVPWLQPYNIGGPIGYFSSGTFTKLYKFDFTGINDFVSGSVPAGYATRAVVQTPWLAFDSPETIKYLRTLDILSGQPVEHIRLLVEGATDVPDFTNSTDLATGTLSTNIHGKKYYPLAGVPAKYRFYRFTFIFMPTAVRDILNYIAIEYRPSHRA